MIVIVGYAIIPSVLMVEANYAPPVWLQLLIWLPATLISALALLQPIKETIVGLQWQLGMQGFAESKLLRLGIINPGERDPQSDGCATAEMSLLQPKS